MNKKLLVIQAAALGYDFVVRNGCKEWEGLSFQPLETVFPAVTCTAQASFRTGLPPSQHGMVGNGVFHRDLMRPLFWEQSSALVSGQRIWESFRSRGKTVGMLFWQQSLGESVDVLISPAPIHKHHGGMIQSCYSKPAGLYDRLRSTVGRDFNLMNYWGPLASVKSSDWIASATAALLKDKDAPDLCFSYLPVLDYDLQRFGPDSEKAKKALTSFLAELKQILNAAEVNNYDVLVFGDYAIRTAGEGAVLPNLALRNKGLLNCRDIKGALYPDLYTSPAFAVVDHEVAHVYVKDRGQIVRVRDSLMHLQGVKNVLDSDGQIKANIAHSRSGPGKSGAPSYMKKAPPSSAGSTGSGSSGSQSHESSAATVIQPP